ncbi:MAG: hypothetical protein PVJ46_12380 [Methyloceanibacter sp.]|jgi:hypothetical protein
MQHVILRAFLVLTVGTSATVALAASKAVDEAKCAGIFYVNKDLAEMGKGSADKPASYWEGLTGKATAMAFEAAKGAKSKEQVEAEIGEISTTMGLPGKKEDPETLSYLSEQTPQCKKLVNAADSTP